MSEKEQSEKVKEEVESLKRMGRSIFFNNKKYTSASSFDSDPIAFYSQFLSDDAIFSLDKINERLGKKTLRIQSRFEILDIRKDEDL